MSRGAKYANDVSQLNNNRICAQGGIDDFTAAMTIQITASTAARNDHFKIKIYAPHAEVCRVHERSRDGSNQGSSSRDESIHISYFDASIPTS
jgi:hypothetical protein